MERKLASVQLVESVEPIKGSDFIEKIRVLGWVLVAKKGEFKPGDMCFYFEVDSVLPPWPMFEFLAKSKYRLKAKKLRGVVSMGLAMPIRSKDGNEYPNQVYRYSPLFVGQDMTESFGVKKYEHPNTLKMGGDAKGTRPMFVPKTDETRIQTLPRLLNDIHPNRKYSATVKYDGTSGSFYYKDGEFGVTSHNIDLKNDEPNEVVNPVHIGPVSNNVSTLLHTGVVDPTPVPAVKRFSKSVYWEMARKYNIPENMENLGLNLVIQGEICGPGIQKNRLDLKEVHLFVFDVFDIDRQEYFGKKELDDFCEALGLEQVEVDEGFHMPPTEVGFSNFVECLLDQSKGKYKSGYPREGIVIRPDVTEFSQALQGRISFKVINPDFLLKGN
jgi:RNA ligase (TIGR02306 family)